MRKNVAQEVKDAVIADYSNGMNAKDIQAKYTLSYPTVRKYVANSGLTIRGRGRPKKQA